MEGAVDFLDSGGERLSVKENITAFLLVGGFHVPRQELGQPVHDIKTSAHGAALVASNIELGLVEDIVGAGLNELGLALVHAGEELFHVAVLGSGLLSLILLGANLVVLLLLRASGGRLLVADLRRKEQTRSEWLGKVSRG